MEPENGGLSDAMSRWEALREIEGSRATERVEFVYYFPEPDDYEMETPEQEARLAARAGLAILTDAGVDPEKEGLEPTYYWTGVGWGADATAIVITVASTATAVAGGIAVWLELAEKAGKLWARLRKKEQLPILSLGAINLLAMGDLALRLGDVSDIELRWAGDVTHAGSVNYTGDSLYLVLFHRRADLWIYLVDSYGRIVHSAESAVDPTFFWAADWTSDEPFQERLPGAQSNFLMSRDDDT